jgi:hypothetical protein
MTSSDMNSDSNPGEIGVAFQTMYINKQQIEQATTLTSTTPNARNSAQQTVETSSTHQMQTRYPEAHFLGLAFELRLFIYELLLISRCDPSFNPLWMTGDKKKIMLDMPKMKIYRTMEPDLLAVCKQIHYEASSILYTENIFSVINPAHYIPFLARIGPVHIKELKTLEISVPGARQKKGKWIPLLEQLAQEAESLRDIKICFNAEETVWGLGGWGKDVDFVRALGKIGGLEKLELKGYYAKRWPEYLEEKTGAVVVAKPGFYEEGVGDEQEMEEKLASFIQYQRGAGDIVP